MPTTSENDPTHIGAQGVAAALRLGSVVIMSSAVAPDYAMELAARLAQHGVSMLDALVSGGTAQVGYSPIASRAC